MILFLNKDYFFWFKDMFLDELSKNIMVLDFYCFYRNLALLLDWKDVMLIGYSILYGIQSVMGNKSKLK